MTSVIQMEDAVWLQKGKAIYKVLRHTTVICPACQGKQECSFLRSYFFLLAIVGIALIWSSGSYFRCDDNRLPD